MQHMLFILSRRQDKKATSLLLSTLVDSAILTVLQIWCTGKTLQGATSNLQFGIITQICQLYRCVVLLKFQKTIQQLNVHQHLQSSKQCNITQLSARAAISRCRKPMRVQLKTLFLLADYDYTCSTNKIDAPYYQQQSQL
uniref:Uncharacterized protein n=1 Tax=Spironucleus salmonicida TaxID=348837 RepID=V6LUL6_9EUKA|eukprot:EST47953.1 Hypothetical protein SS50377_11937 [Spironucleus salmonicida]